MDAEQLVDWAALADLQLPQSQLVDRLASDQITTPQASTSSGNLAVRRRPPLTVQASRAELSWAEPQISQAACRVIGPGTKGCDNPFRCQKESGTTWGLWTGRKGLRWILTLPDCEIGFATAWRIGPVTSDRTATQTTYYGGMKSVGQTPNRCPRWYLNRENKI